MENTYEKNKGNAGLKGVQFQLDLLTLCLLNALDHHKDWKISCENKNAGKYDDIVIELPGGIAVLVQVKHKENRKITKEQFLSDNSKNADFSLPKYFFSYEEIKSKFRARTVIVCTNTAINMKGLEKVLTSQHVNPDSVLYYENEFCSFYTFNENILPDLKRNAKIYLSNNLRDKSIDKTMITNEKLKDFLKNLQIFSSYPCEGYLHKIIEQLLSRSNCSSLCCKISTQEILRKVEDWFKQPKGEYLTKTLAKAMLCEIKSDKYCESLENYNLSFEQNDLSFTDSNRIFHIKVEEGYLLQILKIHHALQNDKSRKLFVNPNEGLEVQKQVIEAFELQRYTLLVMTWTEITEDTVTNEISAKLRGILNKYKYKKVVLVAEDNTKLAERIGLDISKVDGSVTFDDLSKDCQEELLNRKNIIFQGSTVSLKELLHTEASTDYTKSLNTVMLEKLIRKEEVKVGVRPSDLDENIARFYVSRKFEKHVGEVQTGGDIWSEESLFDVKEKAIVISDIAGMGKSTVLTKMSAIIKESKSHLWVIKINLNDYTNILSDTLRRNRNVVGVVELLNSQKATKLSNDFEIFVFSMTKKVVLMLDGVDEISPDYTDLILTLLDQCRQDSNIAKIYVTTRPHVALELEVVLKVESFKMLPFTRSDQVNFLTNFWTHNLNLNYTNKGKCEQYAKILIDNLSSWTKSNHSNNPFVQIPLQITMVAKIFQENIKWKESADWEGCKEYLSGDKAEPKLPQKFNIAVLYDAFIEKKRNVFIDKGNASGNTAVNQAFSNHFKGCLAYHQNLALKVALSERERGLFSSRCTTDTNMEEYALKIGIVHRLGEEIQFVHRSFAEYFVADNIVQELKLQNPNVEFQKFLIDAVFPNDRFEVIRAFLDVLLRKVALPADIFKNYRSSSCKANSNLIFQLASGGHVAILQLLLKSVKFKIIRGKKIKVADWLPKLTFQKRNTLNDLKILVRKDGVNIKNDSGCSPLHLAVKGGHWEMVNFLVEQGADVNSKNDDGCSALHLAIERVRSNIMKYYVVQFPYSYLKVENKYETAVRFATKYEELDIVKYFVAQAADLNIGNNDGNTALHLAVKFKITDIVERLVEQGADLNVKANDGTTALHFAAKYGSIGSVKYLVGHGADLNVKDKDGNTPLHLAARRENFSTLQYLVEQGAHLNVKDVDGNTALHLAVRYERLDAVKYLVQHGADINARATNGSTALSLTVKHGYSDIAKYLVDQGAYQ